MLTIYCKNCHEKYDYPDSCKDSIECWCGNTIPHSEFDYYKKPPTNYSKIAIYLALTISMFSFLSTLIFIVKSCKTFGSKTYWIDDYLSLIILSIIICILSLFTSILFSYLNLIHKELKWIRQFNKS